MQPSGQPQSALLLCTSPSCARVHSASAWLSGSGVTVTNKTCCFKRRAVLIWTISAVWWHILAILYFADVHVETIKSFWQCFPAIFCFHNRFYQVRSPVPKVKPESKESYRNKMVFFFFWPRFRSISFERICILASLYGLT